MWLRRRRKQRSLAELRESDPFLSIELETAASDKEEPEVVDVSGAPETLDLATAIASGPTPPSIPASVAETGLGARFLLGLVLKVMYTTNAETPSELGLYTALAASIVDEVLEDAKSRRLVSVLGVSQSLDAELRYELTELGMQWSRDALESNRYAGPAPVPIEQYREQVARQRIGDQTVSLPSLASSLEHLVLQPGLLERVGPALNSGKAIMLFGGSGNGKTSVAEAVIDAFESTLYLPYAIEADGQIVTLYEPGAHQRVCDDRAADARWVHCKRPAVIAGGELSMEMLDLTYDPVSNIYDAPSHIKATGGVFVIDDFGRQRASAEEILNRWILPLDRGVDFLTLRNGKKLQVPFDQIVVFSTNSRPGALLDEAALRRIPYKIEMTSPTATAFERILDRVCEERSVAIDGDDVLAAIFEGVESEANLHLSSYQPRFLIEYTESHAAFFGTQPMLTAAIARDAIHHLAGSTSPS